jgi:hypothetical protein
MNEIDREANVFYCPRAKSSMTPCIVSDGRLAEADDGSCVACGVYGAEELKDLVPKYVSTKDELAALRDECDRAVRSLGVFLNGAEINEWWLHIYHSADAMSFKADSFAPGDFDYLRQLIESEEG